MRKKAITKTCPFLEEESSTLGGTQRCDEKLPNLDILNETSSTTTDNSSCESCWGFQFLPLPPERKKDSVHYTTTIPTMDNDADNNKAFNLTSIQRL